MLMDDKIKLDRLKLLLGITGTEKDIFLEFALENAEEIVRNYCHVEEVPKELSTTVFRMSMDLYRSENIGNESGSETVKSISQGDTSVTLETSGGTDYKQSILKNYETQLRKYRKLVW